MKTLFSSKYFWLFLIVLGLQITLSMIQEQIEGRTIQRDVARTAVRESWTGEQELFVGLLAIPYQEQVIVKHQQGSQFQNSETHRWKNNYLYITPDQLLINVTLNNQSLAKGIYTVPVYTAQVAIEGDFKLAEFDQLKLRKNIRFVKPPFISLGVSDSRGIVGIPRLNLAENPLVVQPGTGLNFYPSGFKSMLKEDSLSATSLSFTGSIKFNGMEQLSFLTTSRESNVKVKSDWPHPVFNGAFLPVHREISESGYSADWKTGVFSTNINSALNSCYKGNCNSLKESLYGVRHVQSVDIYLQSLRSIKYGMLVILVTFCIFILYEIISTKISIHPMSYLLTGTALAIFFLLLIALSEHIDFVLAYWISCIACSGLIAFYISHQSGSPKQGIGLMGILNSLYLILLFIIRSEDHALLSGSLLLFFLLTVIMFITRKIDWYKVLESKNHYD